MRRKQGRGGERLLCEAKLQRILRERERETEPGDRSAVYFNLFLFPRALLLHTAAEKHTHTHTHTHTQISKGFLPEHTPQTKLLSISETAIRNGVKLCGLT
ncbi:hypothetical protein EXN66_Car009194 [Channa argus]|uniref:Uncharacterized protein n=1 Tax=Channa argus TaxID=215402 RepID=A0A6G1PU59_CHAAH|nr:hypothetical protein EXN66_Car009194 [Channa argus]